MAFRDLLRGLGLAFAARGAYRKAQRDFAREVVKEQRRSAWRREMLAGLVLVVLVAGIAVLIVYSTVTAEKRRGSVAAPVSESAAPAGDGRPESLRYMPRYNDCD